MIDSTLDAVFNAGFNDADLIDVKALLPGVSSINYNFDFDNRFVRGFLYCIIRNSGTLFLGKTSKECDISQ